MGTDNVHPTVIGRINKLTTQQRIVVCVQVHLRLISRSSEVGELQIYANLTGQKLIPKVHRN